MCIRDRSLIDFNINLDHLGPGIVLDDGRYWVESTTPFGNNDYGTPGSSNIEYDYDGDGHVEDDCDNLNPNISPSAVDIPDDGIDQDCDGEDSSSTGTVTVGEILISEIMHAPSGWVSKEQYIELYNTTSSTINLKDFSLAGLGEESWTIPDNVYICLLYTSPSPRDATLSRMPSSA